MIMAGQRPTAWTGANTLGHKMGDIVTIGFYRLPFKIVADPRYQLC